MAMQPRTWSLSALAVELGADRRTLARDLASLPPAESRRVGGRTEKRWLMADVLEHMDLGREPSRRRGRSGRPHVHVDAEMIAKFTASITEDLFPTILEYFRPLMLGGLADDYKMSRKKARMVYGYSVIALSYAFQHALDGDENMVFRYPDETMELLKQAGDESRAAATTQEATQ